MFFSTRIHQLARCQARLGAHSLQPGRSLARRAPFQRILVVKASAEPSTPPEEFEGLLPEEDVEVPGSYQEAVNPNTKLGKAVKAACDELEILGKMEQDSLQQFNDKLKQLGFNMDIFAVPPASEQAEEEEQEEEEEEGGAASSAEPPKDTGSSQPSS